MEKARIRWTSDEREVLRDLALSFDPAGPLSDAHLNTLYELVPEEFDWDEVDGDVRPTRRGWAVEHMIDKLAAAMRPRGLL